MEKNQNANRSPWDKLGALIPWLAPVTAALTGTLYIAGSSRTNTLIGGFGIPRGALDLTIDRVLATGYLPIALLFIVSIIEIVFIRIYGLLYNYFSENVVPDWMSHPLQAQSKQMRRLLRSSGMRAFTLFQIAVGLLLMGFMSGALVGIGEREIAGYIVKNRCNKFCMIYSTKEEKIVGFPLVADQHISIIRTINGISLIKTDELKSVSFFDQNGETESFTPLSSIF